MENQTSFRKSVRISDNVELILPKPILPTVPLLVNVPPKVCPVYKIIPMRELEGLVKFVMTMEKTRRLVTTNHTRGYITGRIHLSMHYSVFTIDTGRGRWFFYLLQNEKEYDMIREYNELFLEVWDYYRDGMECYVFVKHLEEYLVEVDG